MSDYAFVAEKARKAFDAVAKLEAAIERSPEDRVLQVNLAATRRFAEQARTEMENLAAVKRMEVCQYRLISERSNGYSLEHVAKSLLSYQQLFSQIYDAVNNGKKSRAGFGRESEIASALEFGFTFSGSLGVILLARDERDLIAGRLDAPIEALYQVLDIKDRDDVREMAQRLGRAVIKRVHDWSTANVKGGFSADISWRRSDGRQVGQMVHSGHMERIVEYIDTATDEKTISVRIKGHLVGADLVSRTFHIKPLDGESRTGQISQEMVFEDGPVLNRLYEAELTVNETFYYATEKKTQVNVLRKLIPIDIQTT
jgi:hypothetical protein